jgi:methylenetetrahydrofolate reductase (NADPH)
MLVDPVCLPALCSPAPPLKRPALFTFQQAVREKDFCVTAELPLAPGSTVAAIARDIDALRDVTDAVQTRDSPDGVPHISALVAAGLCLQRDKDVVLHMSGRDRNRIALQSDILGAAAAGITSILMMRGAKLPDSLNPPARKVYDFGAKRLLRCASRVGSERQLVAPPGFFLGSTVTALVPADGWQPRAIQGKAEAGCKFVQTQALLDLETLRAYMQRLVESRILQQVSAIVSVPLPSSVSQVRALMQRTRAALIPGRTVERMSQSRDPRMEGITICAETLAELKKIPGVAGANIVAINDCEAAAEAISLSEIRSK